MLPPSELTHAPCGVANADDGAEFTADELTLHQFTVYVTVERTSAYQRCVTAFRVHVTGKAMLTYEGEAATVLAEAKNTFRYVPLVSGAPELGSAG